MRGLDERDSADTAGGSKQSHGSWMRLGQSPLGKMTPFVSRHGSLPLTDATSSKSRGFGIRFSQTPTVERGSASIESEKPLLDTILASIGNLQKLEKKVMIAMKDSKNKNADEDSDNMSEMPSPPNSHNANLTPDESSDLVLMEKDPINYSKAFKRASTAQRQGLVNLKIIEDTKEIEKYFSPGFQHSDEENDGRLLRNSREKIDKKQVRFEHLPSESRVVMLSRESLQDGVSPSLVLEEMSDEEDGVRRAGSSSRKRNPNLGANVKLHGSLMLSGSPSLKREKSPLLPLGKDINEASFDEEILKEKMYRQQLKRHLNQVAKDNYKLLGFSNSPKEIKSSIPSTESKRFIPSQSPTDGDRFKISRVSVSRQPQSNLDTLQLARSQAKKVTYVNQEKSKKLIPDASASKQRTRPLHSKVLDNEQQRTSNPRLPSQERPTIEIQLSQSTLENLVTNGDSNKQKEDESSRKEVKEDETAHGSTLKEEIKGEIKEDVKEEIKEEIKEVLIEETKRPPSRPKRGIDITSLKQAFLSGKKFRVDAKGNLIELKKDEENANRSVPFMSSHGQISDGSSPDHAITKQASLGVGALHKTMNRVSESWVFDGAGTLSKKPNRLQDNGLLTPRLKSAESSSLLPSRGSTRGKQTGAKQDMFVGPGSIANGIVIPENELLDMQTFRVRKLMQQTAALKRGWSFDVFFDDENVSTSDLYVDPRGLAKRHNSMFVRRNEPDFDITDGYMAKRKLHAPFLVQDSVTQRSSEHERESITLIPTKIDLSESHNIEPIENKSVVSNGSQFKKNSEVFTPKTPVDSLTQDELARIREKYKKVSESSSFKNIEKKEPVDLVIEGTDIGTTKKTLPKTDSKTPINRQSKVISEFKPEKHEKSKLAGRNSMVVAPEKKKRDVDSSLSDKDTMSDELAVSVRPTITSQDTDAVMEKSVSPSNNPEHRRRPPQKIQEKVVAPTEPKEIKRKAIISKPVYNVLRKAKGAYRDSKIDEEGDSYYDNTQDAKLSEAEKAARELERQLRRERERAADEKTKAILRDPLANLEDVVRNKDLDAETKIDLFLYGNRKEQIKAHLQQIEATIEENIYAQTDCLDELKGFFDFTIKDPQMRFAGSLMTSKHSKNFSADSEDAEEEEEDERSPSKHQQTAWQGFGGLEEIQRERLRRKKFQNQHDAIQKYRQRMEEADPVKQFKNVDIEDPEALREENYLADMFFKFTDFETREKKDYGKMQLEYIEKMTDKFRRLLLQVKEEDPRLFASVVKRIKDLKEQYDQQTKKDELKKLVLDAELQKLDQKLDKKLSKKI